MIKKIIMLLVLCSCSMSALTYTDGRMVTWMVRVSVDNYNSLSSVPTSLAHTNDFVFVKNSIPNYPSGLYQRVPYLGFTLQHELTSTNWVHALQSGMLATNIVVRGKFSAMSNRISSVSNIVEYHIYLNGLLFATNTKVNSGFEVMSNRMTAMSQGLSHQISSSTNYKTATNVMGNNLRGQISHASNTLSMNDYINDLVFGTNTKILTHFANASNRSTAISNYFYEKIRIAQATNGGGGGTSPIWWHKLENATDPSEIGANPTWYGSPSFQSVKFNNGFHQTSSGNYFTAPSSVPYQKGSLSLWIKSDVDSSTGHTGYIYSSRPDGPMFFLCNGGSAFYFQVGEEEYSFSLTFSAGELFHLALTWDGTASIGQRLRVYKNNNLVGLSSIYGNYSWGTGAPTDLNILSGFSSYWVQGSVDNVKIYDQVLTDFTYDINNEGIQGGGGTTLKTNLAWVVVTNALHPIIVRQITASTQGMFRGSTNGMNASIQIGLTNNNGNITELGTRINSASNSSYLAGRSADAIQDLTYATDSSTRSHINSASNQAVISANAYINGRGYTNYANKVTNAWHVIDTNFDHLQSVMNSNQAKQIASLTNASTKYPVTYTGTNGYGGVLSRLQTNNYMTTNGALGRTYAVATNIPWIKYYPSGFSNNLLWKPIAAYITNFIYDARPAGANANKTNLAMYISYSFTNAQPFNLLSMKYQMQSNNGLAVGEPSITIWGSNTSWVALTNNGSISPKFLTAKLTNTAILKWTNSTAYKKYRLKMTSPLTNQGVTNKIFWMQYGSTFKQANIQTFIQIATNVIGNTNALGTKGMATKNYLANQLATGTNTARKQTQTYLSNTVVPALLKTMTNNYTQVWFGNTKYYTNQMSVGEFTRVTNGLNNQVVANQIGTYPTFAPLTNMEQGNGSLGGVNCPNTNFVQYRTFAGHTNNGGLKIGNRGAGWYQVSYGFSATMIATFYELIGVMKNKVIVNSSVRAYYTPTSECWVEGSALIYLSAGDVVCIGLSGYTTSGNYPTYVRSVTLRAIRLK